MEIKIVRDSKMAGSTKVYSASIVLMEQNEFNSSDEREKWIATTQTDFNEMLSHINQVHLTMEKLKKAEEAQEKVMVMPVKKGRPKKETTRRKKS